MDTCIFLKQEDKHLTTVGFSRVDFKKHLGVSGLKYYLIVMYLRKHLESFGDVSTTLNKLLDECGYSTKSHNKSLYEDFREIIKTEIIDKGFATCSIDIKTISPSAIFTISLSEEKSIFYTNNNFVQLSIKEFETITECNNGSVNKSVLVGVYLFIKQYIMTSSVIQEYLPQVAYPSKQQIKKGIGISSITTIENAISELENLHLIYVGRNMYIEDSENEDFYIPTRNLYGLTQDIVDSDTSLQELQRVYGRTVYREDDVPGKITFINKQKG